MKEFNPDVAVVVPCRNRSWDFNALNRFLRSLEASDFPKCYLLYVPVLTAEKGWQSRENATVEALKSECKYFLLSDNDCHVPPEWWVKSVKILQDPTIGALAYLAPDHNRRPAPPDGEAYRELTTFNSVVPPVTVCTADGQGGWTETTTTERVEAMYTESFWDGFVLFTREYLIKTGFRGPAYNPMQQPNAPLDPLRVALGDFRHTRFPVRTVLANIVIPHDKNVPGWVAQY